MSMTSRLDRFQRRHPPLGFVLAVLYKFGDDSGTYLAALLTYYGFVSFFPLLLLFSTVLGFVLRGNPGLQQQLLHSALREFPVIGPRLSTPEQLGGGVTGLIVGGLVSLYGGLGIAQAVQYTMNIAWAVPRNRRPNPFAARGRSLLLLCTGGMAVLCSAVLSALGSSAAAYGADFGVWLHVALTAAAVVINALVFVQVFKVATPRGLTVRQVLPGALVAAVAWQLLQSFGGRYVGHVVKHASATNAVFALVLGMLAFIYLASLALVISVEIDVVRVERLWPRSLLTPFTDNVELTRGDERVYAGAAKAQGAKGFEEVDVRFGTPPHLAAAAAGPADGARPAVVAGTLAGMTSPEPEPQPRDIAMEVETPEQAAELEAESERGDGEAGDRAQP